MMALGARYASAGGVLEVNAARSGCAAGAKWCLHDALVTERPHNPETFDLEKDYQGFLPDRPAAVAYLRRRGIRRRRRLPKASSA